MRWKRMNKFPHGVVSQQLTCHVLGEFSVFVAKSLSSIFNYVPSSLSFSVPFRISNYNYFDIETRE